MKIIYKVNKETLKKSEPLVGVHKVSSHPTNLPPKKPSKFSIARVLLLSLLLFLLEILVGYLLKTPIVYGSINLALNPDFGIPVVKYDTLKISISPDISPAVADKVKNSIENIEFKGKKRFEFVSENADFTLTYSAEKKDTDIILSESYLVTVGHLYWVRDELTKASIQKDGFWVEEAKYNFYKQLLTPVYGDIKLQKATTLTQELQKQENIAGVIDVLEMNGQYKLLRLDGKYFFADAPTGGIPYYLVLTGNSEIGKSIVKDRASEAFPPSFSKENLLSIRMTGVTAITRGLGIKTNASKDSSYAARKIGAFLSQADLTHVSNEVSFLKGCSMGGGVSFCSDPSYINALKKSGVDIVELTGNHNNDKGSSANTSSIKTYKALGWDYFGGGLNAADATKILYKDVKGTKVAFLGYNYYDSTVGSPGALASSSRAGANSWSTTKVKNDVAEARKNADVVIVDFQYQECWAYTDNYSLKPACYEPLASPNQKQHFRQAVDAGADIVIGTQAHQPQTYEIYKGKVIYYGLGNLFFDQSQWLGTRQGLILTHYMYEGKYLATDITTTIYDNDLLTYVTTGKTRSGFLSALKSARK